MPRSSTVARSAADQSDLTPGEGERIARLLAEVARALELVELEQRIAALEAAEQRPNAD